MFASLCSSLSSLLTEYDTRHSFLIEVEKDLQRDIQRLQQVEDHELYVRDVEECERWLKTTKRDLRRTKRSDDTYDWFVDGVRLAEQQLTAAQVKLVLWETERETVIAMRRNELTRSMIGHVNDLRRFNPHWQPKRSVVIAPPPTSDPVSDTPRVFDTAPDALPSPPTDDPLTPTCTSLLRNRRAGAHSLHS